jgi:plastocyanin
MSGTALRLVTLATLALLSGGCGASGDDRSPGRTEGEKPEAPPGVANSVSVALKNFSITPKPAQAPAGTVTFELTSAGTHNFIVIRTELAPDDLPLLSDVGPVDTTGAEGTEVVGLVPIPFKGTKELTVEVGAGDYVLICNAEAHYLRGMRTGFTVV